MSKEPNLWKKMKPYRFIIGSFLAGVSSVIAFLVEAFFFASYSAANAGSYSETQSLIFTITVGIGLLALVLFGLSILVKTWQKNKALAILVVFLMLSIPASGGLFLAGVKLNQPTTPTTPNFTGQQLFEAINIYRKSKGVPEVKLEQKLCNNLAQRYFDIKSGIDEGVAHKGLDEWYKKFVAPYGNYAIQEDFAWGETPEKVIEAWEGSPGHRLSILDPKNTLGCSYAADGYGVVILGYKVSGGSQQNSTQTFTGDGSRTGRIIKYKEWCSGGKEIGIYENELITKKSKDGNIYTMTQGDWNCYEATLNN